MIKLLSHAMFLRVLKSWVYRTKKKVWCGSKIFIKIELKGPHEWYYVKKKWKKPLAPGQHLGFFILIQILQNQCIFGVFLIKLTKFECLLCLNGGSYGPENYFFWSYCGYTSGWWIMTIRNYSIVLDDPSQRHMFLRTRIQICWVLTIKLTTKCAANDL